MPRRARVDAPGAVHHVMIRGIERRRIFRDDNDHANFAERLERLVPGLGFRCFAWALMPNHVHLALQTGPVGLSRLMARLATGYACAFNLRHGRSGHLFQNRFKSRLVAAETDLAGLVTYIHANPLEGGLVPGVAELEDFAWCGHGALLGRRPPRPFESPESTLALFAGNRALARRRVRRWIKRPTDASVQDALDDDRHETGLGSDRDDSAELIRASSAKGPRTLDAMIRETCARIGADEASVRAGRRGQLFSVARAEIAYEAVHRLGLCASQVSPALGVSESGISRAIDRAWRDRSCMPIE